MERKIVFLVVQLLIGGVTLVCTAGLGPKRGDILQPQNDCVAKAPANRRTGRVEDTANTKEWWSRSAKGSHEYVHKLDSNNFEQFRMEQPSSLVMFYAKWCYYSQICTPDFASAAEQLKSSRFGGVLGALDCDDAQLICQQQGITSFPTFLYFEKGRSEGEKYSFQRKANEFVSFMLGKSYSARNMPIKML